jgi:uncharacterized protein YjbI with pentapeptide repeats
MGWSESLSIQSLMSSVTIVALALAAALVVVFIVAAYVRGWSWAGLAGTPGTEGRPKTLWDWLQLLIIPLGLAGIAFALNLAESGREQRREDRRAALERSIATDQRRDDALGTYVQQISDLMLERGLLTSPKADSRAIARTLTLSVLRRLDGRRKGFVVQFLGEAGLINGAGLIDAGNAGTPKISMAGADLRGVRINGTLKDVDLSSADLREADFRGSSLDGVRFDSADLRRSDFRNVTVLNGSFDYADLRRVDFRGAGLTGVSLGWANLSYSDFRDGGLYDVVLFRACLIETRFDRAELTFLDLKGVSGRDVSLAGATLEAVKFKGTFLVRVHLAGARLGSSNPPNPNEKLHDPNCRRFVTEDGPKAGP